MRRLLKDWQGALLFVKPDTVIRWHRKGWKYYWKRKSKPKKQGRPPISFQLIYLIRRMSKENPFWGAPHIHDELALLGHDVAETTVAKSMVRSPNPERQQSWRTFLKNHLDVTAACDFFTVPTLTFKMLYCFVILSHDRRKIIHINVTQHPTAEWTTQQIKEAFPGDGTEPRFLIRDRDAIYGDRFRATSRGDGDQASHHGPSMPLAERLLRASDRVHSPRMYRSCDRFGRTEPASHSSAVSELLQRIENTLGNRWKLPHCTQQRNNWSHRCRASTRRTSSSIPTCRVTRGFGLVLCT